MLTLYDHTTSVCAIKVRLTLEEKGLDYESRNVDLRRGEQFDPAYLKLNPGAVVPTLVHDDRVITESSIIQCYVEDAFPEPTLLPSDPYDRARLRHWMKRVDDPIHPAGGILTHAISFRKDHLARTPEQREARFASIPDPARRARQRSVYEEGLDSPIVIDAVRNFDTLLGDMEAALSDASWLAGDIYTLADAAVTPYANRLHMLDLLPIWETKYKRVADWFARVRERPSFDASITRYFNDDDADRFRPHDPDAAEKVQRILAAA